VISRITAPVPESMVMENLFDDAMVVVAAKHNPWTRRRRIELADLVNEPWTLPPFDSFAGAIALEAFRAIGLKPPSATVITLSMNMRNRLLATGRFITLLAGYSLMLPGKHPSLKALPVELSHSRGTVAIVTLRNRTLSPLADLFIKTAHAVTRPLAKAR
jgi:DNA-binding transcriptional LysR family regulator